jgi:methionyl-tRNA formyltransferase
MDKMKIGYFADGPWSHKAFEKIIADSQLKIEFICVRFDTKDDTLKKYCSDYEIDYLMDKNINSKDCLEVIAQYNCDLFVSMSFNQIFKNTILNMPRLKTINCHAGKLPFYRGRNILNWALINDEKEFGITIHYIDDGIDTGDIILQKSFPITDSDDYSTLLVRAYEGCALLLYKSIKIIKAGTVKRILQQSIHPVGFYCSDRREGDENLFWNQSSRDVFNFIRSISLPGPQARTFLGKNEVFINRAEYIPDAPNYKGIPGAVLKADKKGLIIKTKDSFIRIVEWSCKSKIKMGNRLK